MAAHRQLDEWIWWEHKHKTLRHKVIPQGCADPLEQAARPFPDCRQHCAFYAAAEIVFVFSSLVTHWPLHPSHQISSHSQSHIPLLILSSPSSPPPSFFPSSSPSTTSTWLSTWSLTALYKWMLTILCRSKWETIVVRLKRNAFEGNSSNFTSLPVVAGCRFNGVAYQQGDSWEDGCTRKCVCLNSTAGMYECTERWVFQATISTREDILPICHSLIVNILLLYCHYALAQSRLSTNVFGFFSVRMVLS